jgi:hypothetical protein
MVCSSDRELNLEGNSLTHVRGLAALRTLQVCAFSPNSMDGSSALL